MKIIKFIPNDYFGSNTYLVENENGAILIDCSVGIEKILKYNKNILIKAIFLTHSHFDHILKLNEICSFFNCPVYILENCENKLFDNKLNLSDTYNLNLSINNNLMVKTFKDSEIINLIGENIKIFSIKGHSSCSVCFLIGNNLFSGDTLFNRAIGRYDFFDSDKNDLINSLKLLKNLKFKNVYPGHENDFNYDSAMKTINTYIKFLVKK